MRVGRSVLVLLSSYNGQEFIEEQLRSIAEQKTEYEIKIKIRDDGSCDNTCEIIKNMQLKYPHMIELIQGDNVGYNESFFRLMQSADGYDYYAFSDQDDVWLPEKIQIACDELQKEDPDTPLLFASTSYVTGNDLKPYGITRKKQRELTFYNTIIQTICPGHGQVFNHSLLKLMQGKVDTSRIYAYDLWTTNMAALYGKILFSNEPLTYYRQHKSNLKGTRADGIGKILKSGQRVKFGGGKLYREQIAYFAEINQEELINKGFINELNAFLHADSTVQRILYTIKGRLYRQSKIETIAFYIAVIIKKI